MQTRIILWLLCRVLGSTVLVTNTPVWRAPFLFEGLCVAAYSSDRFVLSQRAPPPYSSSIAVLHLTGLLPTIGRDRVNPPSENDWGQKHKERE